MGEGATSRGLDDVATGPFYRNSRMRLADITDGLSQTVFVGEHTTVSDKTWVGVVPGSYCHPRDPDRYPFSHSDSAATYVLSHSGPSSAEPDTIHPPSFPTCHVCQLYSPWSVGGSEILFGDGSVRFVSTGIHLDVWAALCSARLGEPSSMNGKFFLPQASVLRRHLGGALCCLIFIALGVGLVGCNRYARVQSEESLKFIQQLYTACKHAERKTA